MSDKPELTGAQPRVTAAEFWPEFDSGPVTSPEHFYYLRFADALLAKNAALAGAASVSPQSEIQKWQSASGFETATQLRAWILDVLAKVTTIQRQLDEKFPPQKAAGTGEGA